MFGFSGVTVVLLATLGGAWGWRVGSKRLYRRSISYFDDDGEAARRRRRRMAERYLLALLYAVSVAAGAAVLIAVMTQR